MAVPYELIVLEDLDLGAGQVERTMPGGGTAQGTQINFNNLFPASANPSFILPLIEGGVLPSSSIELRSTGGVGTADFVRITVGNNGAVEALRVITDGKVGIGTTTPGTLLHIGNATKGVNAPTDAKVLGLQVCRATSSATQFNIAALFYAEQTAANSNSIQGAEGYAVTSHATSTVALSIGLVGNTEHAGAGTLTAQRGVQAGVHISSTGGGTDAPCFYASPAGRIAGGSGTFTNGYGLYVTTFGAGFTNKYGIYVADAAAQNYFNGNVLVDAGSVGIGTTTPTARLHVGNATKGANATTDAHILGMQVCEATADSSQFHVSALFYAEQTAATANSIQGAQGYTVTSNPSGTITLAIGLSGNTEHAGAATLTGMRGVQGGIQISSTGGGTDAACIYASPAGRIAGGSGTFTNGYGLYVGSFGAGFTNKYGVYVTDTGASNYFGGGLVVDQGNLGVGNTSPQTRLHVGNATKGANAPVDARVLGMQVCFATSDTSNFHIAGLFYAEQTVATTNSIQGVEGYAVTSNPSGTITLSIGVPGNCEHAGAGTLTNMRGVQGGVQISSTGGGTDAACFFASPAGRIAGGSGTFTNGYGVKVGSFGAGFTNVYALHCSDATAGILLTSDIAVKSTTNTWQVSSDRRLKRNIRPFTDGLALLEAIDPVLYELNSLTLQEGKPGVSVIAQDVEPVLSPELRAIMIGHQTIEDVEYLTFNNGPLTYVMHNAIRELAARVRALEGRA